MLFFTWLPLKSTYLNAALLPHVYYNVAFIQNKRTVANNSKKVCFYFEFSDCMLMNKNTADRFRITTIIQ